MTGKVPVKDMDNLGIGLKLDADEGMILAIYVHLIWPVNSQNFWQKPETDP